MYYDDSWGLAEEQWQFYNYKIVYPDKITLKNTEQLEPVDETGNKMHDHFNWGVVGEKSLTWGDDNYATKASGAISGKMYLDRACTQETKDFGQAKYGDVAYWATKGKYRMPTEQEMRELTAAGYISNKCNTTI
ncbi:hypothetical protein HMPREF3034_02285 [Prevotella sp. DNF00663]|nr:hypothetical protein HMPREF3034_02285 [Prevotella sp. DNF00663]